MKTHTTLGYFFAFIILTGCVSLGDPYDSIESIPPGKALLYMYRLKAFAGGGVQFDMHVNDKLVCVLANGGYYPYFIEPGKTTVWTRTEVKREVTFVAEAGNTYYIKGSVGFGIMVGRPVLTIVHADRANTEITSTQRIADITETDLKRRQKEDDEF